MSSTDETRVTQFDGAQENWLLVLKGFFDVKKKPRYHYVEFQEDATNVQEGERSICTVKGRESNSMGMGQIIMVLTTPSSIINIKKTKTEE